MTTKKRRFVEAYFGEAAGNAAQAARIAGYSQPQSVAYRVKKELSQVIEQKRIEQSEASQVSGRESLQMLGEIARMPEHKDRVRAIELLLKVHGLLSDKLSVTIDRKTMLQELDLQLKRLSASNEVIDVVANSNVVK